jgi:hypothetical protein
MVSVQFSKVLLPFTVTLFERPLPNYIPPLQTHSPSQHPDLTMLDDRLKPTVTATRQCDL